MSRLCGFGSHAHPSQLHHISLSQKQKLYQAATSAPAVVPAQLSQLTPNKQGFGLSPGALGVSDPGNQLELLACRDT